MNQLEGLSISGSLSCSFCNAIFEDQAQQRLHYKLDWHRYNLKQRLHGFKSISEDGFDLLANEGIYIFTNIEKYLYELFTLILHYYLNGKTLFELNYLFYLLGTEVTFFAAVIY